MTSQSTAADMPHHAEPGQPPEPAWNKPVERSTLGGVQLATWRNIADDGRLYHSYSIERRYRDREGNWATSTSFSQHHLVLIRELIDQLLMQGKCLGSQLRSSMLDGTTE